jgi:hypothetical protein
VLRWFTTPVGLQLIGILVLITGVIDLRERQALQGWIEEAGGAGLLLLGLARARVR